jgi:Flp pilus assembly pilin Flp
LLQLYCWLSFHASDLLDVQRRRRDDGQGLAEYALILALIAIVAIIALVFLGSQIRGILSRVGTSV